MIRRPPIAFTVFACLSIASVAGATDIPGGPVSGTWTPAGSPYNVMGDITIPSGQELVIEPAVEVVFQGDYELTAEGVITAVGTVSDSVYFSATGDWQGIRLENETLLSRLEFCRIAGADRGVNSINSPVDIIDCHLHEHTTAIDVFGIGASNPAQVRIMDSKIELNLRHGIFIVENSNTLIQGCEIRRCALDGSPRGAIQLSNQSAGGANDPTISDNWIHDNIWQGITAFDITGQGNIDPLIEDNVIEYNLTGIYLLHANGRVRDNQINHNFEAGNPNSGAGVMVSGASAQPVLTGNTLTGNFTAFYVIDGAAPNLGDVGNAATDDDGGNHMHDNVDPGGNTWSVYSNSVADIKAENNIWDSENFAEIAVTIFDGNDNPAYGVVDFDPLWSASGISELSTSGRDGALALVTRVAPNPFRARTTLHLDLSSADAGQRAVLSIYDVDGRLVRRLLRDAPAAGNRVVEWDARDERGVAVSSGHYFARLEVGDRVERRRLTVLR